MELSSNEGLFLNKTKIVNTKCPKNMSSNNVSLLIVMCIIVRSIQQLNAFENVCQKHSMCDSNENNGFAGNLATWKASGEQIVLKELNATFQKPPLDHAKSHEFDPSDAAHESGE